MSEVGWFNVWGIGWLGGSEMVEIGGWVVCDGWLWMKRWSGLCAMVGRKREGVGREA